MLLNINLTEPVVFLRSSDPSGRLRPDPNDPPTLVRGVLNLNIVKPIWISTIEVELTGVLTVNPQEEIGSYRIELPDKQLIHSSTVTVFRADQVSRGRRPASVGPGLITANSLNNDDEHAVTTLPRPPSSVRRRSERRGSVSVPPDLGPTPPYTYAAQYPTPIQSWLGATVESPAQTLEELGRAPRDNPEGQVHRNGFVPPSFLPHSIQSSLSNPTIQSNAPSTLNDSLHRENNNHTGRTAHMSPPNEGDSTIRNITEESPHILLHDGHSPSRPSRTHSPGNFHTHANSHDSSKTPTSRSSLHLSLSSVLDTVREVASRTPSRSRGVADERERGRTRFRNVGEEQSRASILEGSESVGGTSNDCQLGTGSSHPNGHMEHRGHHLLGLGRILGLERDHGKEKDGEQKSKEHGEGWREFKPGTYNYPISFLLPPSLPPTFSVPHGSLDYVIKAVAHRPGTFTSKLSCRVPLIVVAAPTIGDGEGGGDPGPLIFQKQWEGKLAYSFELSSRLFLLGSQRHLETAVSEGIHMNTGPLVDAEDAEVDARAGATYGSVILDLTILPLEKTKIWRLGVAVDQRIRYVDERGRIFKDDRRQVRLLEVHDACSAEEMNLVGEEKQTHKDKHRNKDNSTQIPLLPTPISPHRSPLLQYVPPSTDPSVLAGPGPYTLSASIGLPGCNDPSGGDRGLHFTVKHKSSSVRVEHSLRVAMRVEWVGDDGIHGHEGDKQRLFDIAVQTPITILSCRCNPEYQTLPRYSQITEHNLQNPPPCVCQPNVVGPTEQGHGHEVESNLGHVMTPDSGSSFESEDGAGHFHREADEQRSGHRHSRSPSRARRSGHSSLLATPLHSRPPSPASRTHEAGWRGLSAYVQTHSHGQHYHSGSQSYTVSTSHVRAHSQTPISTPHPSYPPSPLVQYERLVSGLESDAGDAPPSYESIASGH